jgi:AcrR family transcriptional regulator
VAITNPVATVFDAVEGPRLRPGRKPAGDESVAISQRGRLIGAVLQSVAAKGLAATTIGDIVTRAKVSRVTFYEHFATKEDCFLAAYDEVQTASAKGLRDVARTVTDPRARLVATIDGYLAEILRIPGMARVFYVEIYAAGDRGLAKRRGANDTWAEQVRRGVDAIRAADPEIAGLTAPLTHDRAVAVVVGISELVMRAVEDERTGDVRALREACLGLVASAAGGDTDTIATLLDPRRK